MKPQTKSSAKTKLGLYKVGLATAVVAVLWIVFEIYFSYQGVDPSQELRVSLEPFVPNLYLEEAPSWASKERVEQVDLDRFVEILGTQKPKVQVEVVEVASGSAEVQSGVLTSDELVATGSGEI